MNIPNDEELLLEERSNALIARYLESVDRGEQIDPKDWVDDNEGDESLYASLMEFLGNCEFVEGYFQSSQISIQSDPLHDDDFELHIGPQPDNAKSRLSLQQGSNFGRYEIQGRLGTGGMGSVYLAYDSKMALEVALKIPDLSRDRNSNLALRFEREARALANARHRNICPIYHVDDEDGYPYISMHFINGKPLSALISETSGLQVDFTLSTVAKLADALHVVHRQTIIHRDLKPSNVMIDQDQEPIILDFGLAYRPEENAVSHPGLVVGTPYYMSPGQFGGRAGAIEPSFDIHGLGVVFYEMLTGRHPYNGGSTEQIKAAVIAATPIPPSAFRDDIPESVDEVCLKMMAGPVNSRHSSMDEVIDAIGRCQRDLRLTPTVSRPTPAEKPLVDDAITHFQTRNEFDTDEGIDQLTPDEVQPPTRAYEDSLPPQDADRERLTAKWRDRVRRIGTKNKTLLLGVLMVAALFGAAVFLPRDIPAATFEIDESVPSDAVVSIDDEIMLPNQSKTPHEVPLQPGQHVWKIMRGETLILSHRFQVSADSNGPFKIAIEREVSPAPPPPLDPEEPLVLADRLEGVQGTVRYLTYSPSGHLLVVADDQNLVRVWDVHEKKTTLEPIAVTGEIQGVAFSPEGDSFAVCHGKMVELRDVADGTLLRKFEREEAISSPIEYSPDGKLIAVAETAQSIGLWSTSSGERIRSLPVNMVRGREFVFHPDGRLLAAVESLNVLRFTDVHTGNVEREIPIAAKAISAIAFTSGGRSIAVAMRLQERAVDLVQLIDVTTGKEISKFKGFAGAVGDLAFLQGGSVLATVSDDQTLCLWRVADGQRLKQQHLPIPAERIVSQNHGLLLATAGETDVSLWRVGRNFFAEVQEPVRLAVLTGHSGPVRSLTFSADGRYLYSADRISFEDKAPTKSTIRVWDMTSYELTKLFASQFKSIEKVRVSSDDQHLLAMSEDGGRFECWNRQTGQRLHTFDGAGHGNIAEGRVRDFDFIPNRHRIVVVGEFGHTILDTDTLDVISHWKTLDKELSCVTAFGQEGRVICGARGGDQVRIWNTRLITNVASFTTRDAPTRILSVSESGQHCLVGTARQLQLWDLAPVATAPNFRIEKSKTTNRVVRDVTTLSPDGRHIIAVDPDGPGYCAILFDAASLLETGTFAHGRALIGAVSFGPRSDLLALGREDATIEIWQVPKAPNLDAVAAKWALAIGGQVVVKGHEQPVTSDKELPDEPYECVRIDLSGNDRVTADGLAYLRGLSSLVELNLSNSSVTDDGLQHLGRLPRLTVLNLSHTSLTGSGFAQIHSLPALRSLYLDHSTLNSDYVFHLTRFEDLRTLTISHTLVNDLAMAHLATLPCLEYLAVESTNISDDAIDSLSQFQSLTTLRSRDSGLSKSGLSELKAKQPQIKYHPSP